jgi:hypothetical protein
MGSLCADLVTISVFPYNVEVMSPAFEVRRRKFSGETVKPVVEDVRLSVDDSGGLLDAIRSNSELHEVRAREILEIIVREDMLTAEDVARLLVVVQSEVPDDMPIGLNHEVLWELLGDDAYKFAEEEWNRTEGKIIRRAVFINGRTFVPFIDSGSSEIHLVECESISLYEKVQPKFTELAGIGFTEENSMVSGYEGEEVGLISDSDDIAIWYVRHDEDPDEVLIFRQDAERHASMVLELMTLQFRPFMSKIMVEGLIGRIPEEFGVEIPEAWVEDEGSWTAITSLTLSPLLTSESPRSPIRQAILDILLDTRRGENFEAWLAEYIESVIDPNSVGYEKRLARQARVEAKLEKWTTS